MLALKAKYENGKIELIEPMPDEIESADLNIVVLPHLHKVELDVASPASQTQPASGEEAFKQIGLAAFFDTDDDANVDWEDYFGLTS